MSPEDLAGTPLQWLQQGRTPVARGPNGILRLGPPRLIQQEIDGRPDHPLAPAVTTTGDVGEQRALLEADLGGPHPDPPALLQALHDDFPGNRVQLEAPLGALLEAAKPWPGRIKLTPLIRTLRDARDRGAVLPFTPRQKGLQRALDATVSLTVEEGLIHGAVRPDRCLEGGLCHWRHSQPRGHRAADRAPLLSVEEADDAELLHIAAQSLRADPVRAAEALAALIPTLAGAPAEATLHVSGHPGLSMKALEAVLGCPVGRPAPAAAVARALGRAGRLVIGGEPLDATASPPLVPRKDPRFWQPRGRDPRRLLSRWHDGVRLDEDPEARFSLTPEEQALQLADRMRVSGRVVLDGFCGAGGNAIAFARRGARVVALDTDARRLEMARHNATLYGVADRIRFQQADFFRAQASADVVFLDPPWAAGAAFLDRAWEAGRARFAEGTIKLPREHPIPATQRLRVYRTPEGFPAFVTASWAAGAT